jgi:ABC-2 type transport system ATP-binding protein
LILDEPAASLDPMGRHDILELMERLRKYTTIFYSTHILDDVQRVSDTVAILNKGELLSQGPIDTLLAGSEGPVFTLTMVDISDEIAQTVRAQAWVSNVQITDAGDGKVSWMVAVSDPLLAERQLLRLILEDPDVRVLDFRRRRYELEDVFMQMVEGDNVGK